MKKQSQLGMNPSTASGRLNKDILFKLLCNCNMNECFRCGKQMTREDFSIEHKIPWLDSEDPVKMFFDLDNIAFSHKRCNFLAARRNKIHTYESMREADNKQRRERRSQIPVEERKAERKKRYQIYNK